MIAETSVDRKRRLNREYMRRYRKLNPDYWKSNPETRKLAARKYYLENKERLKPIRKAWMEKNKVKWNKYQRQWQKNNPDHSSAYTKAWAMRNPERAKEVWKSWDERHPERRKQIGASFRKRHPEVGIRQNTIRRFRVGDLTRYNALIDEMVKDVSKLEIIRCSYCKIVIVGQYHFDHIVPIARGGKHVRENLCVACVSCNLSKGPKLLTEWKNGIYANR